MNEKKIIKILKANRDSYILNDDMKVVDPVILEERFELIAQSIHKIYKSELDQLKAENERKDKKIKELLITNKEQKSP
jgi:cobalamin biosynthesis Co2+ chelatase CbiK